MEKGDKVFDIYVSDQFNSSSGFGAWIDDYTVDSLLGENEIIVRTKYGTAAIRQIKDIFETREAAVEAMIKRLNLRMAAVAAQIAKFRESITPTEAAA